MDLMSARMQVEEIVRNYCTDCDEIMNVYYKVELTSRNILSGDNALNEMTHALEKELMHNKKTTVAELELTKDIECYIHESIRIYILSSELENQIEHLQERKKDCEEQLEKYLLHYFDGASNELERQYIKILREKIRRLQEFIEKRYAMLLEL